MSSLEKDSESITSDAEVMELRTQVSTLLAIIQRMESIVDRQENQISGLECERDALTKELSKYKKKVHPQPSTSDASDTNEKTTTGAVSKATWENSTTHIYKKNINKDGMGTVTLHCQFCSRTGHTEKFCYLKKMKCFTCGVKGHIAVNCIVTKSSPTKATLEGSNLSFDRLNNKTELDPSPKDGDEELPAKP